MCLLYAVGGAQLYSATRGRLLQSLPMKRLPKRRPDSHKGDYGRVLVVAGSRGMAGAAVLAGEAAYRSGAGLVYYCCPADLADVLSIKQTCGVVWPFEARTAAAQILEYSMKCDVAVIGPGLSQAQAISEALREVVGAMEIPLVIDADGLNAFEAFPELLGRGKAPRVLTPHPGEAARLLKALPSDIQADRTKAAKELAERFLSVALLKGHRTVVADGKQVYLNKTGNPGMATGGSGDVLAGIIGALMGQKLSPFDAACLGAHLHGKAGDLAARKLGQTSMMATDLLQALPEAFRKA
ncbi:MAG: NAD(P)H-hydrate dehydratase [Planctomycetes bacterium]|nr:NAD(P)H-hydrate dehydratase [Planctomycetota bacterium]